VAATQITLRIVTLPSPPSYAEQLMIRGRNYIFEYVLNKRWAAIVRLSCGFFRSVLGDRLIKL